MSFGGPKLNKIVTVIIPVFNVEKYLYKCVESVINQTYKKLEIILVDDGSTDNCPSICDYFKEIDNRIKVIHKSNGGLSDARNVGLDNASGDYFLFVDSDDFIEKETVELTLKKIIETKADMCLFNFRYINESYDEIIKESPIIDELLSKRQLFEKYRGPLGYYYVVAWNKLYSKKAIGNIRFPINKYHEDEFTCHLFANNCDKIVSIANILYNYLQRSNSIMGGNFSIRRLDSIEAYGLRSVFFFNLGFFEMSNYVFRQMVSFFNAYKKLIDKRLYKQRILQLKKNVDNTYNSIKKHATVKTFVCYRFHKLFRFFVHLKNKRNS